MPPAAAPAKQAATAVSDEKHIITSDQELNVELAKPGIIVIDVHPSWAGPCEPLTAIFKKLKTEHGDKVTFLRAQSDAMQAFGKYRNKSMPNIVFYANGNVVRTIKGANAPLIERSVKEEVETELKGSRRAPVESDESDSNKKNTCRTVLNREGTSYKRILVDDNDEKTFAIIKPDAVEQGHLDEILQAINRNRFQILQHGVFQLSVEQASEFYREHQGKPFYPSLTQFMSSAPIHALVLLRDDAVKAWRALMGPANSKKAREEDPQSLRAQFGTDGLKNAVHGSDSVESAQRDMDLFFPNAFNTGKNVVQRTLAMVKPDVVERGLVDEIKMIAAELGFKILLEETVQFTVESATGFYMSHKSKPYFDNMVTWKSSGPSYAMILEREDAINKWREVIGPTSPSTARDTAPDSLRAKYGVTEMKNGLHGSKDLHHALLEIDYVFPTYASMKPESPPFARGGTGAEGQTAPVEGSVAAPVEGEAKMDAAVAAAVTATAADSASAPPTDATAAPINEATPATEATGGVQTPTRRSTTQLDRKPTGGSTTQLSKSKPGSTAQLDRKPSGGSVAQLKQSNPELKKSTTLLKSGSTNQLKKEGSQNELKKSATQLDRKPTGGSVAELKKSTTKSNTQLTGSKSNVSSPAKKSTTSLKKESEEAPKSEEAAPAPESTPAAAETPAH